MADLSYPGYVYKPKTGFLKNRIFKTRRKTDLNTSPYTVFYAEFESGVQISPKPTQDPILTNLRKIKFLKHLSKSGPGLVLGRFGLQIRILHEKLYRVIGSDQFFMNFWKSGLPAGQPTPGWPANGSNFEVGSWKSIKINWRDGKWSLDHRTCDQSSAGSIETSLKPPELRSQRFAIDAIIILHQYNV